MHLAHWLVGIGLTGLLTGCWGSNAYIVEGTVLDVRPPDTVALDHEEVPGLMPAMKMEFTVRDPALLDGLEPGDRVYARLIAEEASAGGWYLAELRETHKPAKPRPTSTPVLAGDSDAPDRVAAPPLRPGDQLPALELPLSDGSTLTVGEGQSGPVLLTFLYTTCPRPEFCPAMAKRLQALQAELSPGEATLVSVTIDPEGDTVEVLNTYAQKVGADARIWRFARLEPDALRPLAERAALTVDTAAGDEILHSLRTWVLDADGRLVERYDDARFPQDRVLQQLRTGAPKAPPGSDGTVTRPTP